MKIVWTIDHPDDVYSSRTGVDEAGNRYRKSANQEVVSVELPDGRRAQGWTPEGALRVAQISEVAA